ncbi:hypothetical protein M9435_001344 [Picochlorum sp. BPE23]|nr:hypothetical protein M9435_001344 [Picochlorum sp. BPE23]|eukprot:jgi/Picre1/30438/NNA_005802.t1
MIDKTQYIRLIEQALGNLGYGDVAAELERVSGVEMQPLVARRFREAVLKGDVSTALSLLGELGSDANSVEQARYLLLCNHYASLVESGESQAALKYLREQIQPLESQLVARDGPRLTNAPQSLSYLAAMLLDRSSHPCPPKRLRDDVNEERQERLLSDLQRLLSPEVLMPENRLEVLLEQAVTSQIEKCRYHNTRNPRVSLMTDYKAGPECLPTVPYHRLSFHTDEVWVVQFSPDGKLLLSASKDGSAVLWNVQNIESVALKGVLYSGSAPINIAAFSPSGEEVLLGSGDGKIRVFEVSTAKKLIEIQIGSVTEGISAAMWANGSSRIAVTCNKELRLINIGPEQGQNGEWLLEYRTRLDQHAYDTVLSADGGTFVSVGQDRMLRFTRMSDNKVVTRGPEPTAVTCLSRSPDGRFLASNLSNGGIHVWQLGNLEPISDDRNPLAETEDPLDKLPHEPLYVLKGLKLSHPGRFVIRSSFGGANNAFVGTGSESSLIHIWHRESCALVASVEGHSATVNAVAWNPLDDHMLASASDDHEVIIWVSQKSV